MQTWFIETLIKKAGPSFARGAILGLAGWLLAKNNILAPLGIVSDAVAHTTTIHWETLSTWAIAGLPAAIAAVVKLFQHQGEKLINKGETQ